MRLDFEGVAAGVGSLDVGIASCDSLGGSSRFSETFEVFSFLTDGNDSCGRSGHCNNQHDYSV